MSVLPTMSGFTTTEISLEERKAYEELNKMTPSKAAYLMNDIFSGYYDPNSEWYRDEETAHRKADEILCGVLNALGYQDCVDIFSYIPKWYS